jgi:hypothetical protein
MTDRIEEIFDQVINEDCPDPLRRFAELVRQDERQAPAQEQTKCPRCGEVNPAEIHTCSPQVAQPVAYMSIVKKDSAFDKFRFVQSDMYPTPVYTAPPPKQWVGLTDEDVLIATYELRDVLSVEKIIKLIEAKLKEKNA